MTGERYTAARIAEILSEHRKWLVGDGGKPADLSGANLSGANLSGANLSGANLSGAKDDFLRVLSAAPSEVPGLLAALRAGKVDGSTYEGECACLVGTIANVRGCEYTALPDLKPDASRPAERLFLAIRKGDTPATNPIAAIVEGWTTEWLAAQGGAK